jgi:hypothetical protein
MYIQEGCDAFVVEVWGVRRSTSIGKSINNGIILYICKKSGDQSVLRPKKYLYLKIGDRISGIFWKELAKE